MDKLLTFYPQHHVVPSEVMVAEINSTQVCDPVIKECQLLVIASEYPCQHRSYRVPEPNLDSATT